MNAHEAIATMIVPALAGLVNEAAQQVGGDDPFAVDETAQWIVHELADFLVQGRFVGERVAPYLYPTQLTPRHAQVWFEKNPCEEDDCRKV